MDTEWDAIQDPPQMEILYRRDSHPSPLLDRVKAEMATKQTRDTYDRIARLPRSRTTTRLEIGDTISATDHWDYTVDEIDLDAPNDWRDIPSFLLGILTSQEQWKLFGEDTLTGQYRSQQVPLSKAVHEGIGKCTEVASLFQLLMQERHETALVHGEITFRGEPCPNYHSFNFILDDGLWLVDTACPLRTEDGLSFFAEVSGLSRNGKGYLNPDLPDRWNADRRYTF